MPTPTAIISTVASLMNDTEQALYTNAAVLPYLNLALNELQELYELNGIPKVNKTSAAIRVKAGVKFVGFDTTPALPSDLIEIDQLWESFPGQNQWTRVDKKDFIPHYLEDNVPVTYFLIWAWKGERIELLASIADMDLKIDYISSIFKTPILIANVNVNINAINVETYLVYKTASLCANFIAENETRAQILDGQAFTALQRALGIPIKGMQTIVTRRRPFRYSYKQRGVTY